MIFFADNDGTITNSVPSPVYQGSANVNNIYLVAPFARNTAVAVAFILPNGVITERFLMTPIKELDGIINKSSNKKYSVWSFSPDISILQRYGTVTVQFYFYAAQDGAITATSSTTFPVGKGVSEILPDSPSAEIYNAILNHLASIQEQIDNSFQAGFADEMEVETETLAAGESAQVEVTPILDTPSTAKAFKFKFSIPQGENGGMGLNALLVNTKRTITTAPSNGSAFNISLQYFNRTPVIGDSCLVPLLGSGNIAGRSWLVVAEVSSISSTSATLSISDKLEITGATGATGESGIDGQDGKSAYEIAVENGYVGTEEEWLASLKGEPGISTNTLIYKIVGDFSNVEQAYDLMPNMFIPNDNPPIQEKGYINVGITDDNYVWQITPAFDDAEFSGYTITRLYKFPMAESAVDIDGKFNASLIPTAASTYNIGGRTKPVKSIYVDDYFVTEYKDGDTQGEKFAVKGMTASSGFSNAQIKYGWTGVSGDMPLPQYMNLVFQCDYNSDGIIWKEEAHLGDGFRYKIDTGNVETTLAAVNNFTAGAIIIQGSAISPYSFIGMREGASADGGNSLTTDFRTMARRYLKIRTTNLGTAEFNEIVPNSCEFVMLGGRNAIIDRSFNYTVQELITNYNYLFNKNWIPCWGKYTDGNGVVHNIRACNWQYNGISFMLEDINTGSKMFDDPTVYITPDTEITVTMNNICE